MHAIVCSHHHPISVSTGQQSSGRTGGTAMEVHGMRSRLRWPVLVAAATLLLAACSQGSDTPSTTAQAPAATTSCASNGDLTMWERSGGNKQMVDMLVAAWNKKNPDCRIKPTY